MKKKTLPRAFAAHSLSRKCEALCSENWLTVVILLCKDGFAARIAAFPQAGEMSYSVFGGRWDENIAVWNKFIQKQEAKR